MRFWKFLFRKVKRRDKKEITYRDICFYLYLKFISIGAEKRVLNKKFHFIMEEVFFGNLHPISDKLNPNLTEELIEKIHQFIVSMNKGQIIDKMKSQNTPPTRDTIRDYKYKSKTRRNSCFSFNDTTKRQIDKKRLIASWKRLQNKFSNITTAEHKEEYESFKRDAYNYL